MSLTAMQRRHWAEESEEGGSINHAVAEHLAACEKLLAEIALAPFYVDIGDLDPHIWRDWQQRIAALLEDRER